ncbi:MAG: TRAP transporter small permease subunit [Halovenus sp.]
MINRKLSSEFVFRLTRGFSALLILLMIVLVGVRIVARWNQWEIVGPAELAQIFVVWITFLNIAEAAMRDEEIKSEYVYNRLSRRGQYIWRFGILAVTIVTALVLVVACYVIINENWEQTTTGLQLPIYLIYIPILVGMVLLLGVLLYEVYRNYASRAYALIIGGGSR